MLDLIFIWVMGKSIYRNFDEEERVVRVLMHYYGVNEILFPPRRPGDKLSSRVYDFYRTLSEEMMVVFTSRKSEVERCRDKVAIKTQGSW